MKPSYDVVIPTIGRASLGQCLAALLMGDGPAPGQVFVVDDRATPDRALELPIVGVSVLRGGGAGPAAARNVGLHASRAEWVAFLDDDVVPEPEWRARLAEDLERAGPRAGGSQGNVRVPLPPDRPPTDHERNVHGLEYAKWATADMAYRREVLVALGGFDERFPRAYREDADMGLRVVRAGFPIERGRRTVTHPVGPDAFWTSVRKQAGNADDALLRALHGPRYREEAGVPKGRRARHVAITLAGLTSLIGFFSGRNRVGALGALAWTAGTAELAWARIAPGPRTREEVAKMIVTSAALPAAATFHYLRGWASVPRNLRRKRPRAVLLDRDGTLVSDVPYNRDPSRVAPVPGAREALDRLRAHGIALAVVSNQSGVAKGLVTEDEVRAVNARVEEMLGPIAEWFYCPHGDDARCSCRKPAPGLVHRAATALGVRPDECALIGDTGADVRAALAAGVRPVLVPTPVTRREEIAAAPEVVRDIGAAVDLLLGGRP